MTLNSLCKGLLTLPLALQALNPRPLSSTPLALRGFWVPSSALNPKPKALN